MIIKNTVTGFVQQTSPRKKYDETARRYTNEPDVDKNGSPRHTILLAVPGERDALKLTVSEATLGQAPEALQGQIVTLTYTAKVQLSWASVDALQLFGGETA